MCATSNSANKKKTLTACAAGSELVQADAQVSTVARRYLTQPVNNLFEDGSNQGLATPQPKVNYQVILNRLKRQLNQKQLANSNQCAMNIFGIKGDSRSERMQEYEEHKMKF